MDVGTVASTADLFVLGLFMVDQLVETSGENVLHLGEPYRREGRGVPLRPGVDR